MKITVALLAALLTAGALHAQEQPPTDSYEFIIAKLEAEDGKYDDALARLDRIIAKTPDNSVLHYERAMILIDAGRIQPAEKELRAVTEKSPDFFEAQRILGRLLLDRAGNDKAKVDEALTHLQAAYKVNPDDLATGMAVSQILLSNGRTADAERVLATLLERAPDQRGLNYNYAQVLTRLGRGNEATQYLERAVLIDPTFGPAILQLVDIYANQNDYAKAADVLAPLVAEDPLNLDLQRQQAYYLLRAGQADKARTAFKSLVDADPKDARSLFYYAESLNDLEQYEQADKIYRQLLEKSPDDPEILASFALAQAGQKKWAEATKTFNTLLGLKDVPEGLQVLAKTQLGYIELQKGNINGAVDYVRPVLVFHDQPNPQAINIALEALRRQKRWSDAVTLLQPLVDKYGSDPLVNARYVEMLVRAGEKDRARVAAATQTKFGTRNTIGAAEAYVATDDYATAAAILREAVAKKADDVDLQFELGSVLERSNEKAEAEKVFLAILDKHPDNTPTLNYLGYMWAEAGQNLDRAADMLNRAVTQEPRNGAYVDSLGWVYFRQGKLDLAEKYLTDATHLLPRDATVHEHLGDVLAKRGDVNRALAVYRTALGLEPESKDEQKIKTKIAELEKRQTAQRQ